MKDFNYQECKEKHNRYGVTESGKKRRLLCDDSGNRKYPIVALNEEGLPMSYCSDGKFFSDGSKSPEDLFTPS